MWRDDSAAISHEVFGGLQRFAFNRNPHAANTPMCVPRRYEFIVYIERASSSYTQTNCTSGKLQRLYSSNGSCIAACAPLPVQCSFYSARIYVHERPDDTRGERCVGEDSCKGEKGTQPAESAVSGKRTHRAITSACTRLILICILIAVAIIGSSGFS